MRHLVYDHPDFSLIAGDDGGRGEGDDRVFHSAVGECWRQHYYVVLPPFVLEEEVLQGAQVALHVLQLF
jgi:hypothetical protein